MESMNNLSTASHYARCAWRTREAKLPPVFLSPLRLPLSGTVTGAYKGEIDEGRNGDHLKLGFHSQEGVFMHCPHLWIELNDCNCCGTLLMR